MRRVIIQWPENHVLHGERGEIVAEVPGEITVRLDRITDAMRGFEDARTGLVTLYPEQITPEDRL